MVCVQIRCFVVGIVCTFLCLDVKASDCMSRAELEARLTELTVSHLGDVSSLKREIRQLKEANDVLEKEVHNLKKHSKSFYTYENNIIDDRAVFENSSHDIRQLKLFETKTAAPENTIETDLLQRKFKKTTRSGDIHKRYLVNEPATTPVAFTVLLNATDIVGLGQEQIVKFDKVLTNIGNAFDTRLGVFTAPFSGVYIISLTLIARPNETQYLYVVKDGVKVFHMYATGSFYNTVTKMVVLQVNKGEELWVQTSEYSGYSKYVHGNEHTSLTGFLLYPTDG